jgi:hypothetical protein
MYCVASVDGGLQIEDRALSTSRQGDATSRQTGLLHISEKANSIRKYLSTNGLTTEELRVLD